MQHPWILPFLPLTSAPIQLAMQQVPSLPGVSLHPVLTPSGTILLPSVNAAAAAAAFAAASAASTGSGFPFLVGNYPRSRLKVAERENRPSEMNGKTGPEKRKHHDEPDSLRDVKRAKIETRALKAKRPGFSEERYSETEYYFENGLRKVYPYYFTFTTFTKGRWVGQPILDVFASEFRAHPVDEYERCIKTGTLTVNYEKVDIDYRLKHNDLLANIVHRHERPVLGDPVKIVHIDDDIVVVHKPASVPVHPCGRYRHNTVAFILAKEHKLRNLRTIHRLDRLTSGLLMFGRTQEKARELEQQIRTRQVVKEYVCRVEGEFPDGKIVCREAIEVVSYKIGVCRVSPKGKECQTEFEKLASDGKTSVVLCRPFTGRMHQIRVHLQYLGYPIVNDPLYNHTVFGPEKGKGGVVGKNDEQLIRDLISIHNAENWLGVDGDGDFGGGLFSASTEDIVVASASEKESTGMESGVSTRSATPGSTVEEAEAELETVSVRAASNSQPEAEAPMDKNGKTEAQQDKSDVSTLCPDKLTFDPHCYECKIRYRDPKPKDLVMYLHAWRYKGPGWEYETQLPEWASSDWKEPVDASSSAE